MIDQISGILSFRKTTYGEIRGTDKALFGAVLVVAVTGILYSFSDFWMIKYIYNSGAQEIFLYFMGLFFNWILVVYLLLSSWMYGIGRILGGKGGYRRYLVVMGYSQVPMALAAIPLILEFPAGLIAGFLWTNLCFLISTRELQDISITRAIIAVYLPLGAGVAILAGSGLSL